MIYSRNVAIEEMFNQFETIRDEVIFWKKQPPIGVLIRICFGNMQQILKKAVMPKCDFNGTAKNLYWSHTLASVFAGKFAAYFQTTFS